MNERLETRILVGMDGSPASIAALRWAGRLSTVLDIPVHAVPLWSYAPWGEYVTVAIDTPETDAETARREAIAAVFGDDPPARFRSEVIPGAVAATLVKLSRTSDLFVLGSRGHGGFVGLLLGSVSAVCAAHSACPVMIMHEGDEAP
ncbi:hypothetical protein ATY41_12195 [Leifsonia xyli subsp. xyli]|uniref:Stress-inducible protein n=2 Tax=Leifsonia xyli subsp. xyli TaxID=59736 RepID=Q6ACH4_LEIXX|nr:universal stress protein [Leifsonia xyli]AAT89919.1 stress-inducible protein [Leifsonia xyli subsp. xyli str. CTCB07]ODA89839.1 hypothetical protein ATY41_12195 [Leifsonia xyli subsp. xyli]